MDAIHDLATLSERIGARFDSLSPQLGRAARFMLAAPDDVALLSMRALAKRAELPPVTFLRLARALGFDDYAGLRRIFQNRLREGDPLKRYSAQARDLQQHDAAGNGWLRTFFAGEHDDLARTADALDERTLERAAALIDNAGRTYVLGQRSCYPPAFLFHYIHSLFRDNATLMENHGGTAVDGLRHVGGDDLVVVVSIAPYTDAVVRMTRQAREQGARVLALTDDALSPVARGADACLVAATATPSFFHSITALVSLVQALLAVVVMRGGDATLAAIESAEQQLTRFGAYWPAEPPPESSS